MSTTSTEVKTQQAHSRAQDWFRHFSQRSAQSLGSSFAFFVAVALVVVWAVSGPVFNYSDSWELVINTVTTIITFLMVFLIQNTQNRDAMALHLKLDELLRAVTEARNSMVDLEELSDEDMSRLKREFSELSRGKRDELCDPTRGREKAL